MAAGAAASADGERLLESHFLRSVRKGEVPSYEDLRMYCKSRGLSVPRASLREMRRKFKFLGVFERIKGRPPGYLKNLFPKYGQVQCDLAFYREGWRKHNGGVKGEEEGGVNRHTQI